MNDIVLSLIKFISLQQIYLLKTAMKQVEQYIRKHHDHMIKIFKSMSNNDLLEATKVFSYIQSSFTKQNFRFLYDNKDFFTSQENGAEMQKILENYYRKTTQDSSKKFYLYRIQFQYQEIGDILEFWISQDPKLKIVYIEETIPGEQKQEDKKSEKMLANKKIEEGQGGGDKSQKQEQKSDNEFQISTENIPDMIIQHQRQIQKYQSKIAEGTSSEEQVSDLKSKIKETMMKIQVLEQRMKTTKPERSNNRQEEVARSVDLSSNSPEKNNTYKGVNYKALFNFYAKQQYATGVKATFQRIQNESKSINYQKLIHFLRQYEIMPKKPGDNKKLHLLYIKNCDNSRTLSQQGFKTVLLGVMKLLEPKTSQFELRQLLDDKIISKSKKDKLLHNPFHILEKEDFRINSNEITYNFKIIPQYGKFQGQIVDTLEQRRKDKIQAKEQREKERKLRKIKYLKKLQSIDPFNEQLVKNSNLLTQKSFIEAEPIANLQNMEKYRDSSFDIQRYLGIEEEDEGRKNSSRPNRYQRNLSLSQESYKKAERIEKYEAEKMKNLMNGLIERNNAKMQKMGISPSKIHNFN